MCIHCATADAQYAYNPIWDVKLNRIYKQGDICPACNYREEPMKDLEPKWKKYNQCNHKIKITN